jgi:hypothetical protein
MLLVHRLVAFGAVILVVHWHLLLFRMATYQTPAAGLLQPLVPGSSQRIDKLILRNYS